MVNRFHDTSESFSTRWITLGQACKLLGVNESTLRRWADAGHVRSFRTPGGHRRFSEEDLRALVAGRSGAGGEPYTSLGQLALARIRRRSHLIDEAREIGHEYGKELVADHLGIRDAVEAFAFFRKGLDDAAMELAQKNDLSAEEAVEVWELLANLADQVLLAIAEVYEQAQTPAASAN